MKILFALNLLILIAAVILGDIVFGACAFIGLSGFTLDVLNRNSTWLVAEHLHQGYEFGFG